MTQPTFKNYFAASLFMELTGWGGLYLIIFTYEIPPVVWARWLFFIFWVMALAGAALPIAYFFNRRFPSDPPAEPHTIVRQAIWVGVYGATLAWLQLGRVLTLWGIFGLGIGLASIEYFIRIREQAQWKPPQIADDEPDEPKESDKPNEPVK